MEIVNLEKLYHRSKKRIDELGEVFTPEKYVEDMLNMFGAAKSKFWADESNMFFEPCCGHGNIVLAIYRRRAEALYKANLAVYTKEAAFYAIANSLNSIWAIDIDTKNVESCRARVLLYTIEFLKEKLNIDDTKELISKNDDFFAHILSAIRWHIYENESLSSISNEGSYLKSAGRTKLDLPPKNMST